MPGRAISRALCVLHYPYMFGGMRRVFRKAAPTALMLGLFVGVGVLLHASFPSIAYAQEEAKDFLFSSSVVTFIGNMMAQFVNWIGDMVGSLTLMIIEVIVVNVLNYNNFSNSTIVTLGWTLTRDMVNMFAVIVLLILAIKTMFGQGGSALQQHLPRFFMGIVAANFSRTLCGLAIDASQVVMMTFVNALMSIAAGNFAQLMVMPQATTYSSETFQGATEAGVTLVTLASNIANAYAKMLVQVAVMIVILLLAIAFIWRIVVLWIALIMAPLAGFSWGSKEIVGFLGRFYSEWMGAFVPPLVLGPMLTFFLYLALAASSNGNLAQAEAFPEPKERTTYGQITLEVFESTNFTGLMIAIVFLLLGLQESAKVAAKMGGLAAMAINDKTGRRVLTAGARVSGATVGAAAKLGTRAGLKGASALGSGIELAGDRVGARLGGKMGNLVAGAGMVGGAFGSLARRADEQVRMIPTDASKLPGYAKNRGAAVAKAGSELTTKLGSDLSRGIANNVKSPALASALNALGPNALLAAGSALHTQEHHISEAEAKAAKERVGHMTDQEKAARLIQSLNGTGEKSVEAFADAEHLKGLLFKDKNFENIFKGEVGADFDGHVGTLLSQFQHEDDAGHLSIEKEAWDKMRSKYTDIYAKTAGQDAAKKFIASDDFNIKSMRKEAVTSPEVAFALASVTTGEKKDGKYQTKFDQLNDKQKEQVRGASAQVFNSFSANMFTAADPAAPGGGSVHGGNVDDYARAFSRMEGSATTLDAATAGVIATQLRDIERDPARAKNFQEEELAAIRKNLVASGHVTLEDTYGGQVYDPATFNLTNRKNFKALVGDDAGVLRLIDDAALNDASKDTTKTAFEALSKDSIEKMKDMVEAGARTKAETQQALTKMKTLLDAMEAKARNGVSKADLDDLATKIRQAGSDVQTATTDADRQKFQTIQAALESQRKAMIDQMDSDALTKIKGLRASHEATERYL